jgi:hypothetical protein
MRFLSKQFISAENNSQDYAGNKTFKTFYKELIDGTKIYYVDGNYIRTKLEMADFIGGGHGYYYKKIPKNEIWIEKVFDNNDHEFFFIHEIIERTLIFAGWKYDKAHDFSNSVEQAARDMKGQQKVMRIADLIESYV